MRYKVRDRFTKKLSVTHTADVTGSPLVGDIVYIKLNVPVDTGPYAMQNPFYTAESKPYKVVMREWVEGVEEPLLILEPWILEAED